MIRRRNTFDTTIPKILGNPGNPRCQSHRSPGVPDNNTVDTATPFTAESSAAIGQSTDCVFALRACMACSVAPVLAFHAPALRPTSSGVAKTAPLPA